MSSLTEIREAVIAELDALPERIAVTSAGGNYTEAVEKLKVTIAVGEPSPETEARIDELLARGGVKAMLEADPTLGGIVQALSVVSHAGYRAFERADGPTLLGTEITLQIWP